MEVIRFNYQHSYNLKFVVSNNRGDPIPNLWLCTSANMEVDLISLSNQQITLDVIYLNKVSRISSIYTHTDCVYRRQLCVDLTSVYTANPWGGHW